MAKRNDDFEIELELKQLRQSMEIELELEQLRQSMAPPQTETPEQAETPEQNEPSDRPSESATAVKKKKTSIAAIAVLGLGIAGGAIAAFKAQEWALTTSETIAPQIETAQSPPDLDILKHHRQSLQTAITILETIPNVPGFNYQQARADLPKLRSLQTTVELQLTATESLKAAESLAMEAAILVQNPPHPVQVWAKAREKWQQAIAQLESVSPDTSVSATARQKLSSYQNNLAVINKRMEIAQKAVNFNNRGAAEITNRNYQRAVQYFNQAIALNASQPEAYIGRGIAYSELGNNLQALQNYDKAIQLNPNFAEAYYNRGLSHYELGNDRKAVEDYDRAIDIQPNYAKAYLERGGARYQINRPSEAMADFQKAAQLFSQQGDTKNQELAQKVIDYLEANVQANAEVGDDSEYRECWDAWGNPCNEIYYYVPPKRSRNSSAIEVPKHQETDSIRTPSRTRGGSFRNRRRRR